MNLIDGTLVYPKLSVAEFIAESATWPVGLCAVICDDASAADADLSLNLTEYNALLGRSLSIYNYDSDVMNYYRIEPERFPFRFDAIHREQWRRRAEMLGLAPYPATNESSSLNISYLLSDHLSNSNYGVGFLSLPAEITEVDRLASQIAFDYTYAPYIFTSSSYKNQEMKRTSHIYYVYDQDENYFYRF